MFQFAGNLKKLKCFPLSEISKRCVGYETTERWTRIIGNREVVGYGKDGSPSYCDNPVFPCPAIRFQPGSAYIQALREKEKCDWRNLTLDEKKCLYRASFCQTYSEMLAGKGEWKSILGWTLIWLSGSLWCIMGFKYFGTSPLPKTVTEYKYVQAQVKKAIDMEWDVIDGFASHWDYENECWKPGYTNKFYTGEKKDDE